MELYRGSPQSPEVLAFLKNGVLDLPEEIPQRFHGRVEKRGGSFYVSSLPHAKPWITNSSSLQVNGIWLCGGDAEARGGVEPRVFGLCLSTRLLEVLRRMPCEWRVLYHGTGAECHQGIATLGFLASAGQLGFGVYLGTFWKACRFAGRDQEYKLRDHPLVYRVLTNKVEEVLYPRRQWRCECDKCRLLEETRASACDHWKTWERGKCGRLLILKYPDGGWTTQNDEWVLSREDIVRVCEAVVLDKTSIHGPHYDPQQRDIRIL